MCKHYVVVVVVVVVDVVVSVMYNTVRTRTDNVNNSGLIWLQQYLKTLS